MTLGNHDFPLLEDAAATAMLDLHGGIQISCDVFFYEIARRLGIDKMAEAAHALGLGSPTGIELPGELGGLIPTRAWKMKRFGVPWQQGETLVTGIGQGYVLATPLQLCTHGRADRHRQSGVARASSHQVGCRAPVRVRAAAAAVLGQRHSRMVRQGMGMPLNEPGGTAYALAHH